MTIANGSTILAADLNTMAQPALVNTRVDNTRLPGGVEFIATLVGVVATTPSYRSKVRVVVPVDMRVESIALQTSPGTVGAVVTVDVTGDGALPNFAMRSQVTLTAGLAKSSRRFFDNTMAANPGVNPELTSRVGRLLPRGSTITITVSAPANLLATMVTQVVIIGRSNLARDTA